jgi:hypothetical protein
VRNQLVPYILGALILAIILYLLPGLGHFLEVVFSTK